MRSPGSTDEFSVIVEKRDKILPLLSGLTSKHCEYDVADPSVSQIYLFKNPADAPREGRHSKRIQTLSYLDPPAVSEATSYIRNLGANAVMKITPRGNHITGDPVVVKLAHSYTCDASPISEAYVSDALSEAGVEATPRFRGLYRPDPRLVMIVEDYHGSENGWEPLWRAKLNPERDPLAYGHFVGRLHSMKSVNDRRGKPVLARMLFNDIWRHHVVRNPNARTFEEAYRVLDLGEIELVTQTIANKSVKQRFVNEAIQAIGEHWVTAYFMIHGISQKGLRERNDAKYVKDFCLGYNFAAGEGLNDLKLKFNQVIPAIERIKGRGPPLTAFKN